MTPSAKPIAGLRCVLRQSALPGACLAVALLAGCDSGHQELQSWMDETRRNTPVVRETIAEPKKFEPFRYGANTDIDPFSLGKLKVGIASLPSRSGNGLQPDLSRRREALEAFPLDNLKMVGNLVQGRSNVALLQAEAMVYQARIGNYVGQNFGQITRISETEVALKELVQDAAGDWVERETSLRLQETKK
jgi:type IV pilus assembly protein PilP